ncbi:hypothetical protein Poli38472_011771 [Pythium oligandrum]|uniref:Protein kinase domain-containing protein n=1 Tax=Pythium oligandrum TaxID=41045 RepID=A0A8K1FGX1_PYTOL|nr:hypothetical protein Poli38472_011771 [Pythium oligandrum]|eukprot:TMW58183.1 hypothetical protein Poli38472_011771 [Pythium oligandrum]
MTNMTELHIQLPVGSRLSSVRVLRQLYERPTATVYLCEDRTTTERLVIKHAQCRPAESSDEAVTLKRIVVQGTSENEPPVILHMAEDAVEHECQVALTIRDAGDHPHVVRYFEACSSPSPRDDEKQTPIDTRDLFLVMEYCSNGDLFELLQRQDESRFDEATALYFFRQIVEGLDHIHRLGVAHRDVSLENVLLDAQWQVKLCDFALSTSTNRECTECVGKLHYMAPEVLIGRGYDPVKADVWSLGIMLFIMVTGSPLFHIAAPSDPAWNAVQRVGVLGILTKWGLSDQYSPLLIDLLTEMLRISPTQRLPNLEYLLDRIPRQVTRPPLDTLIQQR